MTKIDCLLWACICMILSALNEGPAGFVLIGAGVVCILAEIFSDGV